MWNKKYERELEEDAQRDRTRKPSNVPKDDAKHFKAVPYKRERSNLTHSIIVDGLGDEDV